MSPIMFKFAIGVLCLVISNLAYETSSCKRYVCFNWKVTVNELKLTCKVSKLHYRVWILNQFGTEQAQCIPPTPLSKCYTYYSNGTISQNPKTNETVFIVHGHIDSHINGNWTCRHGKKRDLAQVEVTVLRTQEKHNTKFSNNRNNNVSCRTFVKDNHNTINDTNGQNNCKSETLIPQESSCLLNVLLKGTLSIIGSIVVSYLLQLCCKTSFRVVDDSLKRFVVCICTDSNIYKKILVCKRIIFCLITVILLTAAIFTGLFDNKNCSWQWIVMCCGLIIELMNSLLFLSNVDPMVDVQPKVQDEEDPMVDVQPKVQDEEDPMVDVQPKVQDEEDGQGSVEHIPLNVIEVNSK